MATIKVCDICGSQNNVATESFIIDRRMDAAGSMDDIVEFYDLCPEHLIGCLKSKIKFILSKADVSIHDMNANAVGCIKWKIGDKK